MRTTNHESPRGFLKLLLTLAATWVIGLGWAIPAPAQRPLDRRLQETIGDWRSLLETHRVAHYVVIGDSMAFRKDTWTWHLRNMLEARYGVAGDGYLAFNGAFGFEDDGSVNKRPGVSFERTGGSWASMASSSGPRSNLGERAVDGIYTRIGAHGAIEARFYGSEATLHYIREPGAGIIRIEVNGVWEADIDASLPHGPPELGTYTFQTGQSDPNVLNVARFSLFGATTEDPQWTQLNGLFMSTGRPGPLFSRLARGGVGPEDFLRCDPTIFNDTLAALDPALVIVMLDRENLAGYGAFLNTLVDRIRAAVPDAEILLMTHHHFASGRATDVDIMETVAISRGLGFMNLFHLHRSPEHLQSLGFLADNVHFSGAGGHWFASRIFEAIDGWAQPTSFSIGVSEVVHEDIYGLRASDDIPLQLRSTQPRAFAGLHRSILRARFRTDVYNPQRIDIRYEARLGYPVGLIRILLWNWRTGRFESVTYARLGPEDQTISIARENVGDYVSINGEIAVAVRNVIANPNIAYRFDTFVDELRVRVR